MGAEYARTLLHLGVAPERVTVLGRRREAVEAFAERFGGMRPLSGGLDALDGLPAHAAAIVAVPPVLLAEAARRVIAGGTPSLLLEKPGALSAEELAEVAEAARRAGCGASLALNRRFFPSVRKTRELIAEDGGLLAASVDFSELECRILQDPVTLSWGPEALARWGLVNSCHVIDLFIHLAGRPTDWRPQRGGALPWHPSGAIFWGSGTTDRGTAFSYLSTWNAAGRWGLEVTTPRRKILLRPLEAPSVQTRDGFALVPLAVPVEAADLKPGFPGMVKAFLLGGAEAAVLCSIDEAVATLQVAETIFGYAPGDPDPWRTQGTVNYDLGSRLPPRSQN